MAETTVRDEAVARTSITAGPVTGEFTRAEHGADRHACRTTMEVREEERVESGGGA
jgi:hypothetical protein